MKVSALLIFLSLFGASASLAQQQDNCDAAKTTLSGVKVNPGVFAKNTTVVFAKKTYDLSNSASLADFSKNVNEVIQYVSSQGKTTNDAKTRRQMRLENIPLYAQSEVQDDLDISGKAVRESLKEVYELSSLIVNCPAQSSDAIVHIQEMNDSLNQLVRVPQPDIKLFKVKSVVGDMLGNKYTTHNTSTATNLITTDAEDLSAIDPIESSFWRRPKNISAIDTYYGNDRTEFITDYGVVCTYVKAKKSFGTHAGFTIDCRGKTLKIKFGDELGEPFQARILYALGFHSDTPDFISEIKLAYDRRILTEINERKVIAPKLILPSFIPDLTIMKFTPQFNAFEFVNKAVLKDGTEIPQKDLPKFLFNRKMADWDAIHLNDPDFNPEAEAKIAYLVMKQSQLQTKKSSDITTIGPWDWNSLEHTNRRDMRAFVVLSSWLGNYDMRYDNNRLLLNSSGGSRELQHLVSDLGAGLGSTISILKFSSLDPNNFNWKTTNVVDPASRQVEFTDYAIVNKNVAFENMNYDDARWMVRLIAELTEKQITDALIASGFSSEFVKAYTEKLISRRDGMVKDFDLTSEIPLLRPNLNQVFNYHPKKDGLIKTITLDGREVAAPDGGNYIVNGALVLPYETPKTAGSGN